ncbi:ABC transporter ATP-binding protein (plasmid) [Haladaptatus sp. SPP-AMP-3]|uniref:ABC transporter ATP-binding protein n=1 Tax=Haladaptatus sp. SPP-AMP-3 TaxID=3121295 RepID=UPI003C2BCEE9
MSVIRAEGLEYTYHGSDHQALKGLDFEVQPGEVFGFLGPSGAGKTTTQKILTGLLDDYEGGATVLDRPVVEWGSDLYRHIGVSPETPTLYQKLTGRENLELFGSLYGGHKRDPLELLDTVGIADAVDRRVGTYSKGMQMRLNFVRSLLHDPELVFLDEPTGGIDPSSARDVMSVIESLRDNGTTVFLTTHDMTVADRLCDRVAFIVNGALPVVDTPRQLKIAHGQQRVRVEYREEGELLSQEFPLDDLGTNDAFQDLLARNEVETIHSEEATLADVFIEITGETLQ